MPNALFNIGLEYRNKKIMIFNFRLQAALNRTHRVFANDSVNTVH